MIIMKTIRGNLLNEDFDVIVHGCNCQCKMESGIAKQIKEQYPEAWKVDQCTTFAANKLGTISFAHVRGKTIVNAYIYDYKDKIDYNALRSCFKLIRRMFSRQSIAYPKIRDWEIVKKIIDVELEGEDHTLIEFDQDKI